MGNSKSALDQLSTSDVEEYAEDVRKKLIHENPSPTLAAKIKKGYGMLQFTDKQTKDIYDAAVEAALESTGASENFAFLSLVHELKTKQKVTPSDLDKVFDACIKEGAPLQVTIPVRYRNALEDAHTKHWTEENNPKEWDSMWNKSETVIIDLVEKWLRTTFLGTAAYKKLKRRKGIHLELVKGNPMIKTPARESYYNKLLDSDEYYEDDYDNSGEYQSVKGISMGPYNGGYNDRYNGYAHGNYIGYKAYNGNGNVNDNFGVMLSSLMVLVGVMCICLVFAALLNVIACAGCYVLNKYQNIHNENKNNYQNINKDDCENNPV